MKYPLMALILTLLSIINVQESKNNDTNLDTIFIVDSSSNVKDLHFQHELDLVYDIIIDSLPINSRVSLINFNKKKFNLNKHGLPYNNLSAVANTVNSLGSNRSGTNNNNTINI